MHERQDTPRNTDTSPDIAARALEALLGDIVVEGRKPVEAPDIPDAEAVHELRKSFKRWRALLRLIAPVVGANAEALRLEARDLAREMAAARDSQAVREALADLGEDALPPRSRSAIAERLARIEASAEAAGLGPALKARVGEALARADAAIEHWPLAGFDCEETTRQLAAGYKRAAAAIPEDWSGASPEALHRFRQRVVAHRYQMEVAEMVWPRLIRLWIAEAQRLRDRLGAHQDLEVLGRLLEPRRPLSAWRSRLAPLIAARQAVHVEAARRLAGRLFAEKPKAFRRRLMALWEHQASRQP
jgi:CHAD domain-containing protein